MLDCLKQLDATGYGFLVVLRDGRLEGVVSDGDVRRGLIAGRALSEPVSTIVNPKPVVGTPGMSRQAMLQLARARRIDQLPIVADDGRLIEILTVRELLEQAALPNRAVIMAGGLGVRLKPLTDTTPKPLLPLAGRPIVDHIITHIASFGIQRFTLSVNHMKHMFPEALGDGSNLGVAIDYIEETERLGTVGALGLMERTADMAPFVVTNGDILTGLDFGDLIAQHTAAGAVITVCLKPLVHDVPFGVVTVDDGRIAGLEEKPSYRHLVSAGIYCISPEALDIMTPGEPMDAPQLIERHIAQGGIVKAFIFDDYWRDIGSLEDYYMAQSEFARGLSVSRART
jgi:dTDP-glucose pyrophosphorylase